MPQAPLRSEIYPESWDWADETCDITGLGHTGSEKWLLSKAAWDQERPAKASLSEASGGLLRRLISTYWSSGPLLPPINAATGGSGESGSMGTLSQLRDGKYPLPSSPEVVALPGSTLLEEERDSPNTSDDVSFR
jgi:hypothetical protein